ncbi:Nephrocystin-4, partial [Cichlidogyrus casuarinus]
MWEIIIPDVDDAAYDDDEPLVHRLFSAHSLDGSLDEEFFDSNFILTLCMFDASNNSFSQNSVKITSELEQESLIVPSKVSSLDSNVAPNLTKLLSENTLIDDSVPISECKPHKNFQNIELLSTEKYFFYEFSVANLSANMENFEKDLMASLEMQKNVPITLKSAKLKILQHNGLRIIRPIHQLTLKINFTGNTLLPETDTQLHFSLPSSKNTALVFVLSYSYEIPLVRSNGRVDSSAEPVQKQCSIRWGIWTPNNLQDKVNRVSLKGTQGDGKHALCPDGSFCLPDKINDTVYNFSLKVSISKRPKSAEAKNALIPEAKEVIAKDELISEIKPPVEEPQASLGMEKQLRAQLQLYQQLYQSMILQQQQQLLPSQPIFAQQANAFGLPPFMIGGSFGPTVYEPIQPAQAAIIGSLNDQADRQTIPATKIAKTQITTNATLTRVAYSKLYAAEYNGVSGFPRVLSESGLEATVIDATDSSVERKLTEKFDELVELNDPLNTNEITFQFMAYSSESDSFGSHEDNQLSFSFQFYRFPMIKSENLLLGGTLDEIPDDHGFTYRILHSSKIGDQGDRCKIPGYQISFTVDSNFLRPGESQYFTKYLLNGVLHIEVWHANSWMYLGSCAVPLKHLLRQGREAVQVFHSLNVLSYSREDTCGFETVNRSSMRNVQATNPVTVTGRLHLKMFNVGRQSKWPQTKTEPLKGVHKKLYIVSKDTAVKTNFPGGSLSNAVYHSSYREDYPATVNLTRARPLKEVNEELREMLLDRNERLGWKNVTFPQSNDGAIRVTKKPLEGTTKAMPPLERQRKLSKLNVALAASKGLPNMDELPEHTQYSGVRIPTGPDKALELSLVSQFRDRMKDTLLRDMLNSASRMDHVLSTSFGVTEFFEFQLENAANHERNVAIEIQDETDALKVITDSNEVRAFKAKLGILTATEEASQMFARLPDKPRNRNLAIFMRPKEKILVPFKFCELHTLSVEIEEARFQTNSVT